MGLEGTRKKNFNSPSQAVLLDVDDFENAARLTIFFLSGAGLLSPQVASVMLTWQCRLSILGFFSPSSF